MYVDMTDDQLADELQSSGAASEICDSMVAAANAAGGQDDITCIRLLACMTPTKGSGRKTWRYPADFSSN